MLFYLLTVVLAQRPSAFGIAFHNIAGLFFQMCLVQFEYPRTVLHPLAGGVAEEMCGVAALASKGSKRGKENTPRRSNLS